MQFFRFHLLIELQCCDKNITDIRQVRRRVFHLENGRGLTGSNHNKASLSRIYTDSVSCAIGYELSRLHGRSSVF
jgi:hypothetical protein